MAAADSATVIAGNVVVIDVLGNDFDAEGDSLTVTGLTQPAGRTVALTDDGSLEYTSAPRVRGHRHLHLHRQ